MSREGDRSRRRAVIVLIGQAPPRRFKSWDPAAPSTVRLATLAGIAPLELSLFFEMSNLIRRFPGKVTRVRSEGASDAFPWALGIKNAKRLRRAFRGRDIILVGARVARCFGINPSEFGYCRWREVAPFRTVAVIPHVSAVNRRWTPGLERSARRFLRREVEAEQMRRMGRYVTIKCVRVARP